VRYRAHFHHSDRAALVAVSSRDGLSVGVARYVRQPVDRESADVAIAIDADWQEGPIATELLSRLAAHARAQGIRRLSEFLPAANDRSAARVVTLVCPDEDALACEVP